MNLAPNLKILVERGLATYPPEGVVMPTYEKLIESSLNTNWTPPSLELLQSVQSEVIELENKANLIAVIRETILQRLAETDYKAIKYAEGIINESEYLPIKNERQNIRTLYDNLENKTLIELEQILSGLN